MAKKQRKPLTGNQVCILTGIGTALVTALIVWICLASIGPISKLERAVNKTLQAKAFTVQFSMEVNGDPVDGIMNIAMVPEEKSLNVHMQMTTVSTDYLCGIYDGYFLVAAPNQNTSQILDIYDRQEAFFQSLEKTGVPDWELLLDLEELDLYDEICDSFDFNTLLSCLSEWLNQLDDKSWARKHAGYSKSHADGVTVYSFQPKPYELVTESLPGFEKAFLQAEDYSDLQEYIQNAKYLFVNGKTDFSFGLKGGKLSSVDFALLYHNTDISGNFRFTDIGTTTVDIGNVAYYIEEYKQQGMPPMESELPIQ